MAGMLSASETHLQFKKFHWEILQCRPKCLKFLAGSVHFKLRQFADLQKCLQLGANVFEMCQSPGSAPVALAAMQLVA